MNKDFFDKSIYSLLDEGLISVRIYNILQVMNIKKIEQLVKLTKNELMRAQGCGRKAIAEIEEYLDSYDLKLGMTDAEIDKIKGIERPIQDECVSDEYWKKLFLDTSINIIGDMKDMDWNTWNTHVNNSIEISKDIVRKLKKEMASIDTWINA